MSKKFKRGLFCISLSQSESLSVFTQADRQTTQAQLQPANPPLWAAFITCLLIWSFTTCSRPLTQTIKWDSSVSDVCRIHLKVIWPQKDVCALWLYGNEKSCNGQFVMSDFVGVFQGHARPPQHQWEIWQLPALCARRSVPDVGAGHPARHWQSMIVCLLEQGEIFKRPL